MYTRLINGLEFIELSPKYRAVFGKSDRTYGHAKQWCYRENDLLIIERWDRYANVYDHVIKDRCITQLAGANIEFLRKAKEYGCEPDDYTLKYHIHKEINEQ